MENKERLKNLILYICSECKDIEKLGATKLNKILWFADSIVYKQTGSSITGTKYKKLQYGPVPMQIVEVLSELENEGKLEIQEENYFGLRKKQFKALSEPQIDLFSATELKFVDFLVHDVCKNHTASSISDLSHDMSWNAAHIGEEIPLAATLAVEEGVLTESDLKWADSVIKEMQPV
ncbi:SocA family protein [Cyanobacteria bacterium FACHB-471]|nr:SocA family protein [Cyanobacteria bacterium FACHB-471]